MAKAQRADRLLRDSANWQDPYDSRACRRRSKDIDEIIYQVWGRPQPVIGWYDEAEVAASLAACQVVALGFDLEGTDKVAYLTKSGWTAWPKARGR